MPTETNLESQVVRTDRRMLCVSAARQNLKLLDRIIEDLSGSLEESLVSELHSADSLKHRYAVVLVTADVPLSLLQSLKASTLLSDTKFVLLLGGPADVDVALRLQESFYFDLQIKRPIKSSLVATELLQLLVSEPATADTVSIEESELAFTDVLKKRYISVVADRVRALNDAVDNLREDMSHAVAPNDRSEAQRLAHNMRGTASSYGLAALANAAGRVESALSASDSLPDSLPELLAQLSKEATLLAQRYVGDELPNDSVFAAINVVALMDLPADAKTETLLTSAGVSFHAVTHVDRFLHLTASNPTDAVLIDIDLDSIDGIEVARKLREQERAVDVPIGFIRNEESTHFNESACAHAGGSLTLQRPLQVQDLINGCLTLVGNNENGRPRILIVDDDPDFTSLISAILASEGMLVKHAIDPVKTEILLKEFAADLLIVDARMPQMTGIELCHRLRVQARFRDLPILFLTAERGVDTRISAYESGADDYLLKPLIVPELLSRVKGRLERARFLRERIEKDALTGLLLRRSFLERLEAVLQDATRHGSKCSICLLDIDHFKAINDTYGHGVGDEVLATLGRTVSKRFRSSDIRGRWGGEEFILAFPNTVAATAKGVMNRLLEEFRKVSFDADGKTLSSVSFSAGVAQFPDDGNNQRPLIQRADELLYQAKHAGRNRVYIAGGQDG